MINKNKNSNKNDSISELELELDIGNNIKFTISKYYSEFNKCINTYNNTEWKIVSIFSSINIIENDDQYYVKPIIHDKNEDEKMQLQKFADFDTRKYRMTWYINTNKMTIHDYSTDKCIYHIHNFIKI